MESSMTGGEQEITEQGPQDTAGVQRPQESGALHSPQDDEAIEGGEEVSNWPNDDSSQKVNLSDNKVSTLALVDGEEDGNEQKGREPLTKSIEAPKECTEPELETKMAEVESKATTVDEGADDISGTSNEKGVVADSKAYKVDEVDNNTKIATSSIEKEVDGESNTNKSLQVEVDSKVDNVVEGADHAEIAKSSLKEVVAESESNQVHEVAATSVIAKSNKIECSIPSEGTLDRPTDEPFSLNNKEPGGSDNDFKRMETNSGGSKGRMTTRKSGRPKKEVSVKAKEVTYVEVDDEPQRKRGRPHVEGPKNFPVVRAYPEEVQT